MKYYTTQRVKMNMSADCANKLRAALKAFTIWFLVFDRVIKTAYHMLAQCMHKCNIFASELVAHSVFVPDDIC